MLGKRPLPVYVFTGFLDCGKTSFIRQTMDEDQFKDGRTTLMIVCEDGEESIDIMRLDANRFIVRKVEDEDSDNLLECIGKSYETVKAKRNLCGAPGIFHFQYRAKEKGTCLLRFEYSRPWEKDAPPANTKEIVITVQ